jgi:flagellin FlaB
VLPPEKRRSQTNQRKEKQLKFLLFFKKEEVSKMWKKFIKRLRGKEKGITGLETAIILIAFVIVASVFAYVVLSAGLFSSQKTKEAMNAGLESTMSTLEIKGNVVAEMAGGVVTHIYFGMGLPAAGSPVDMSSINGTSLMVISYSDDTNIVPSCNWSVTRLVSVNDDDILDPLELFQLDVTMPISAGVALGAYQTFSLEIKPPDGPTLVFERTMPGRVTGFVNLH